MENAAAIAMIRFGLGRRRDENPPENPKAWLRGQLTAPDPTPVAQELSGADCLAFAQTLVVADHMARVAAPAAAPGPEAPKPAADTWPPTTGGALLKHESHALLANGITTPAPFRERLVWFWANHFNVSARGFLASACVGAFVREAIRPHVTGRFSDMLLAVMHHPAMLAYLNQMVSVGPDSPGGLRRHQGLNENLARECLELHTVSPAAGYTQADVTAFAKLLTGWMVELHKPPLGFRFRDRLHEPGPITVMGRDWPGGEEGGIAMLKFLATHKATYRHLAEKLARHFVADDPPPSAVHALETALAESDGDLATVSDRLIDLPEAWHPLTKLRTPQEYVVACFRAVAADPAKIPNLGGIVGSLGQGVFQAPFPIGWPDRAADWSGSEALLQRVDFAYGIAGRFQEPDPLDLAHMTLGKLLTPDLIRQMQGAGSRRDSLTLLLGSPEFQRR